MASSSPAAVAAPPRQLPRPLGTPDTSSVAREPTAAAQDAPPAPAPVSETALLDLPQSLLINILSWSHDADSADALLATCRMLHTLRRLPSAAALLLLRRPHSFSPPLPHADDDAPPSNSAPTAAANTGDRPASLPTLPSIGRTGQFDRGWAAWRPHSSVTWRRAALPHVAPRSCPPAVAAAAVRLLRAGPVAGGPFAASAPLLEDLLRYATRDGDAPLLRWLLARPEPRNLARIGEQLLVLAIERGGPCCEEVVGLLLQHGANPAGASLYESGSPLLLAADPAVPLSILLLLLEHCPAHQAWWAHEAAAKAAAEQDNCAALAHLMPLAQCCAAGLFRSAAERGSLGVLRMLIDSAGVTDTAVSDALYSASGRGLVECAEWLLGTGRADVHLHDDLALLLAVMEQSEGVVRVLLRHGATVTETLRQFALPNTMLNTPASYKIFDMLVGV